MEQPTQENKLITIALHLAPALIRNSGTTDPAEAVRIYINTYDAVAQAAFGQYPEQEPS